MQHDIKAAIAHFPDQGHAIEALARTDEGFRSLCEDFAAAQAALVYWRRSSSPVRETRSAEYRELVRDLAVELAAELTRHSRG